MQPMQGQCEPEHRFPWNDVQMFLGLETNVQKIKQMRLNKSANLSTVDHLVINDQPINIVDDFKYFGSYVGSTEHDVLRVTNL